MFINKPAVSSTLVTYLEWMKMGAIIFSCYNILTEVCYLLFIMKHKYDNFKYAFVYMGYFHH